ncbi:hypothetical protein BDM02DRAFT_2964113 [Thelephora ganbajun]|uniref:Uncharacterized protein n=1 Tax=Thelephora ganbajun TaxID=370292 RepID=A0ACB6ZRH8_THEGA|nr:hypothetical protein BDM02DRAFT_2964113 [Thelephora ganbajun]
MTTLFCVTRWYLVENPISSFGGPVSTFTPSTRTPRITDIQYSPVTSHSLRRSRGLDLTSSPPLNYSSNYRVCDSALRHWRSRSNSVSSLPPSPPSLSTVQAFVPLCRTPGLHHRKRNVRPGLRRQRPV